MNLYEKVDEVIDKLNNNEVETRVYEITGRSQDLDSLENMLRHCEYLGNVGASRNILVRVDGDGAGRIQVKKIVDDVKKNINKDEYNTNQDEGAVVGTYDIG